MTELKIKKNIWPARRLDRLAVTTLLTLLTCFFIFEIYVAIPGRKQAENLKWYIAHLIWAVFVIINMIGNYIMGIIIDNGVETIDRYRNKTGDEKCDLPKDDKELPDKELETWLYCDICKCRSPPRSWHCDICRCCILKRDHHCKYLGCCIGHRNQRYFIMFSLYLAIGTIYAAIINTIFLMEKNLFNKLSIEELLLPPLIVLSDDEFYLKEDIYFAFMYFFNIAGVLVTPVFFTWHFISTLKGTTSLERCHKIYDYDCGTIKEKIMLVYGKRWYLTFLFPFIKSELPTDGSSWKSIDSKIDKKED